MPLARSESPSFAQTTAEFTLDDSDDEDLRSAVGGGGGGEAYEMLHHQTGSRVEDDDNEARSSRRRASVSSVASFQLYTPDEELAVRRKFDRRLVLFVALLFLLSFLDRSSRFYLFIYRTRENQQNGGF